MSKKLFAALLFGLFAPCAWSQTACYNISPAPSCQAQFFPTSTSPYDAALKVTTFAPTGYGNIQMQNAEGTRANPLPSTCGDLIGQWEFDGWDGAGFTSGGGMVMDTAQDWSATRHATLLYFFINPPNNLAGSGTLLNLQANSTGLCPALGPVPGGTAPTVVVIGPNSNQVGGGPANTVAFVNGNTGTAWGGTQVGIASSPQQGSTSLLQFYGDVNATRVIAEVLSGGEFRHVPVPFASLPMCTAGTEGATAAVTDSLVNKWGWPVAGGGSLHVKAYCDGTNWSVMAR